MPGCQRRVAVLIEQGTMHGGRQADPADPVLRHAGQRLGGVEAFGHHHAAATGQGHQQSGNQPVYVMQRQSQERPVVGAEGEGAGRRPTPLKQGCLAVTDPFRHPGGSGGGDHDGFTGVLPLSFQFGLALGSGIGQELRIQHRDPQGLCRRRQRRFRAPAQHHDRRHQRIQHSRPTLSRGAGAQGRQAAGPGHLQRHDGPIQTLGHEHRHPLGSAQPGLSQHPAALLEAIPQIRPRQPGALVATERWCLRVLIPPNLKRLRDVPGWIHQETKGLRL